MSRIIFFWHASGSLGWLSNFALYKIVEDGVTFHSVEQYFMYYKALAMDDHKTAARILACSTPKEAKALGRQVSPWDEKTWVQVREHIMIRALRLKLDCNPELAPKLLKTRNAMLAEANPGDLIWGTGCHETSQLAQYPSRWPGMNLLGKAWMEVRDSLQTEASPELWPAKNVIFHH
jgi:ribA/ribD-fused uncharacterized protein